MRRKFIVFLTFILVSVISYAQEEYDVYLCIGQSNMAGRGYLENSELGLAVEGVYLLNDKDEPVPAVHPFNQYSSIRKNITMQQMHLGCSFAIEMSKTSQRPILLVCNARGGTSITEWVKGTHYYAEAVRRTREAMKYGQLKGILWHQGCADASRRLNEYMDLLNTMVSDFRADLKIPDLPFVVGEIPYWLSSAQKFNEMIRTVSSRIADTSYASAEGCGMRAEHSDPHFSKEGLNVLGIRYAVEMKKLSDRRWSQSRIEEWYSRFGWISGCNFIPSTAINQLEMWDKKTFDPRTINKELSIAENLGFNCMRVFLHHLAWEIDREGFKKRINRYLEIAASHGIFTMFVFLDDCWNESYAPGKQPEPKRGVHNSGWVKDPGCLYYGNTAGEVVGTDVATVDGLLKEYVQDIMSTFKDDSRIFAWDLYNEPGGGQGKNRYYNRSFPLLKKVFAWAREVDPSQPLTAGIWNKHLGEMNVWQIENSDILTYHTYESAQQHQCMIVGDHQLIAHLIV